MEHRAQVGVESPQRHFLEVEIDERFLKSPLAQERRDHLAAWVGSRCPEHLGLFLGISKH